MFFLAKLSYCQEDRAAADHGWSIVRARAKIENTGKSKLALCFNLTVHAMPTYAGQARTFSDEVDRLHPVV
jgi:hypothetical protein